ncbi:hypothetical protein A3A66_04445 [Microgenomates group bacterium RIFCSPLOWO2_01_FULL_46_13]|nr:MAG: hypothetical protein A3A66_04445 [Microgenomates group bacterium RIFCSPLOWO2_01_FULL_46_13]
MRREQSRTFSRFLIRRSTQLAKIREKVLGSAGGIEVIPPSGGPAPKLGIENGRIGILSIARIFGSGTGAQVELK